jgi:LysR family glycine cleavage system transcriptional activator
MARRLPSLHLLRVFEAAGRHQSFKDAAEELHITPSAVSHQVKALEEDLGFALFKRANRSLTLTDGGRAYLEVVERSFNRLREGTDRVLRSHGETTLSISVIPPLARELVIPRLKSFQDRAPDIKLRIDTAFEMVDFRHQDVDVAVRYGLGDWPGVACEKILELTATPVCSSTFNQSHDIARLDQLEQLTLIQMTDFPKAWRHFARAAGCETFAPGEELWLDSYTACLDAAEQGLGLALAMLPVEQTRLDSGRLVAPFDLRLPNPNSVYLVYRPGDGERDDIGLFRDWLLEQLEDLQRA